MPVYNPPTRRRRLALRLSALASALVLPAVSAFAAFGYTASGGGCIVDTGGNLVFTVNSTGDLSSIKYQGVEYAIGTASGLVSGLGASSVTATTIGSVIKITCVANWGMTHYYMVQSGVDNIYMADYATTEPGVGELRWITRLNETLFTGRPVNSDLTGSTGTVESGDVYGMADGTTRSKYYGNQRAMDLSIKGLTGPGRGLFMVHGFRESSSGGPFFRDIQFQTAETYNYMNSGHEQTESAYRLNVLYGPYALCFTTGATPAVPDMSFVSSLGLTGYVANADRGRVILNGLSGRDTAYTYTVGFSNDTAQYWTTAAASNGAAQCWGMKPGTYTMTVYKNELAVYTETVTVVAGGGPNLNTRYVGGGDPSSITPIWRVGNWDGTPLEFRNGPNIPLMHPSDVRNASWTPGTFVIGTSPTTNFPSCQWRDINPTQVIQFNLTAAQVAAHTIRIGITSAYANARPVVMVNSTWSTTPGISAQPNSRSVTIGTYRGNNTLFTYSIPASSFVIGTNTVTISPISGSAGLGGYLSPGYSLDCVDMY